jgi:predicted transcriptional regulator
VLADSIYHSALNPSSIVRTKNDIIARIIEVAKERPVTKTRIAYDCFLSYDLLSECLNTLIKCDLVKFNVVTRTYLATKRGLRYRELCKTLGAYINAEPNNNI